MRRATAVIPWCVLAAAVVLYLSVLPLAAVKRQQYEQLFVLPSGVLRVMSFQFKEVAADISFLNALVFFGGTKTQPDTHKYLPEQYEWMYNNLKNSAALDPYFLDPYYLMNAALIWDRYKLEEVNDLIAKGADARTWDYLLPFYAGFNYYYYLNDADKSFRYLILASKRSGGIPFYASLASRVAYKANKTELAISYLEEQIRQAELEDRGNSIDLLKTRLYVLKGIQKIEEAVAAYQNLFYRTPANIEELLRLGMLAEIPKEPYGGTYYIDHEGRAHSTKAFR